MKMTIDEAMSFIHGTYKFGSKLGLENIKTLLERLGNPQENLKFVHVAGTNGKGSTSSFIANVLMKAGYKTGLYTSPYIEVFNERMRIDGVYISDQELAEITLAVKNEIEKMVSEGLNHPTEFEVVTAIAMIYFNRNHCEIVVLEVGMGGRLDATNAIDLPLVSVITPLALDHTEFLGDTIEKIAYEKGGIIKSDGITVSYPQESGAMEVIKNLCEERSNRLVVAPIEKARLLDDSIDGLSFEYEEMAFKLKLFAPYQMYNAVVAIEVIKILTEVHGYSISKSQVIEGLNETLWMGRLEILRRAPLTIIDGAHNPHGINGLKAAVESVFKGQKITAVLGILEDKDIEGMLDAICPLITNVVVTKPFNPRALTAEKLAERLKKYEHLNLLYADDEIENAVAYAEAHKEELGVIIYFGSLYMIGEVRKILKDNYGL